MTERGLRGNVGFWFDADEGELDNLRFRAPEKLHFFEGVLGITETDSSWPSLMGTVGFLDGQRKMAEGIL